MALSDDEHLALHEILEIPVHTSIDRIVGDDGLVIEQHDVSVSIRQANTALDTYLASLTSAEEAKLKLLLVAWNDLGFDTTRMEGGAVGSIQGLTDDPDNERRIIRQRVLVIVPFYRKQDEMLRMAKNTGFIPVIR
jgi:hypothetical protein